MTALGASVMRSSAAWAALYDGGFEEAITFLDESHAAAQNSERERETARQRELEQARKIAETERLRSEAQQREIRRLLWLAGGLAAALLAAVVALILMVRAMEIAEVERERERWGDPTCGVVACAGRFPSGSSARLGSRSPRELSSGFASRSVTWRSSSWMTTPRRGAVYTILMPHETTAYDL